jgi:hypothetical protein
VCMKMLDFISLFLRDHNALLHEERKDGAAILVSVMLSANGGPLAHRAFRKRQPPAPSPGLPRAAPVNPMRSNQTSTRRRLAESLLSFGVILLRKQASWTPLPCSSA